MYLWTADTLRSFGGLFLMHKIVILLMGFVWHGNILNCSKVCKNVFIQHACCRLNSVFSLKSLVLIPQLWIHCWFPSRTAFIHCRVEIIMLGIYRALYILRSLCKHSLFHHYRFKIIQSYFRGVKWKAWKHWGLQSWSKAVTEIV